MIEPPDGHEKLPHKVGKHYYMMLAEITGSEFLHDDYSAVANWIITKISLDADDADDKLYVYPSTS